MYLEQDESCHSATPWRTLESEKFQRRDLCLPCQVPYHALTQASSTSASHSLAPARTGQETTLDVTWPAGRGEGYGATVPPCHTQLFAVHYSPLSPSSTGFLRSWCSLPVRQTEPEEGAAGLTPPACFHTITFSLCDLLLPLQRITTISQT